MIVTISGRLFSSCSTGALLKPVVDPFELFVEEGDVTLQVRDVLSQRGKCRFLWNLALPRPFHWSRLWLYVSRI